MLCEIMVSGKIDNFYERKPAGKAKQMIMLLHGLGADGQDLIGLAPRFAELLPHAVFISPDAPYQCDMAPYGRQWFSLRDWSLQSMLRGVQEAAPILDTFITNQLQRYNLTAADLALVGFSQGTMMSLYAGPRYPEKIAGILGYSGALVWEQETEAAAMHRIPVCLIHGEADTIVPVTAWHHAKGMLEQGGFTVSGHTTPFLPHGIDEQGIRTGAIFLESLFAGN